MKRDENRPRLVAGTARLDPSRKPTKSRKLKQRREIQAWQEKSERKTMVDREQIIAALTEMSETEYQLTINEARGHRTADAKQLVVDALKGTFGHSTPKETR